MKLAYRGQSYSIAAPAQFSADVTNSTGQSKVKLIYRGQTYYATPRSADINPALATTGLTVTLRYRGITYQRVLQGPKYYPGRTINWRY